MLLLMLERRMPIDMVLTADTGMEFPEMYEHLAKLDEHLYRERGIPTRRRSSRNSSKAVLVSTAAAGAMDMTIRKPIRD